MAEHFHALATGQRIEDYEIRDVLGEGGFGLTYLAHDMKLEKPVAIKEYLPADLAVRKGDNSVIPKSSGSESDFTWGLQRFLDEARVLARFDHKNIVRVHRFFQAHGTAYIVMEYVDGETLSSLLQREHTLSCQRLLSILDPVLSGLEIVHKGDVLHRDIKPGNIIIRDSGVPVLIDFGAARQAVGARSRSVTAIVTPGYAPIEQYSTRGRQGPWTDIYALGAICYRAMTGETPIDATERVRRDPLVPLSKQSIPEGYPGFFPGAVDRALSVDEEERPRSIGEWRDMLEGRGEAGAVSAPTADERAKTRLLPRDSRPAASAGQPQAPSGFKPSRGLVFGGIGAVAVTGLVITLLSFGGRGPTPEPEPPDIPEQNIIAPELAAAWARAQALNTAEAYEGFLGTWPDSPYADDAKAAMGRLGTEADDAAFAQAQSRDLVRSYGQYVQDYPAGRHMDKADDGAWGSAGRQNTANAYQAYLTDFPDGKYIEDARAAIAEAARQEAERQEAERQEAERQKQVLQSDCAAWNSEAFFETASAGDVRACLRAGADPEARDKDGSTPLHWAASEGHAGAITALLEAGADPDARNESGGTPLLWAAFEGHAGAIATLLEAGADPDARSKNGNTSLHWAAFKGHAGAIAALLEAGADPDAQVLGGWTPLHVAAGEDRAGAITALLEGGADPSARKENGDTPFDLIAEDSLLIGTRAYWRLREAR